MFSLFLRSWKAFCCLAVTLSVSVFIASQAKAESELQLADNSITVCYLLEISDGFEWYEMDWTSCAGSAEDAYNNCMNRGAHYIHKRCAERPEVLKGRPSGLTKTCLQVYRKKRSANQSSDVGPEFCNDNYFNALEECDAYGQQVLGSKQDYGCIDREYYRWLKLKADERSAGRPPEPPRMGCYRLELQVVEGVGLVWRSQPGEYCGLVSNSLARCNSEGEKFSNRHRCVPSDASSSPVNPSGSSECWLLSFHAGPGSQGGAPQQICGTAAKDQCFAKADAFNKDLVGINAGKYGCRPAPG